jgi:transposase
MARPPSMPIAEKQRIVLSILSGEMTVAEAARRNKVSEASVHRWKAQFLEGAREGLAEGGNPGKGTARERELAEENEQLKIALGEAAVQIRVWQKSAENHLGPSKTSR